MTITRRAVGVFLACVTLSTVATTAAYAQGGSPPTGRAGGVTRRVLPRDAAIQQRSQQERRLQERIDQVVRTRLGLSADQFGRIRDVASRIEGDRRALRMEEMTARFALRQELLAGPKANEARVGELLDKMPQFERRRITLMEREQRELATFLSPVQRARYIGLQEELRRSMQEVQRRRMDRENPPNIRLPLPERIVPPTND